MQGICFSIPPQPTALLSPSSDGKPEAAPAVVVVPDDRREVCPKHVELYLNDE
jgi:hypothetical protein